jgi:hypothetical protein
MTTADRKVAKVAKLGSSVGAGRSGRSASSKGKVWTGMDVRDDGWGEYV